MSSNPPLSSISSLDILSIIPSHFRSICGSPLLSGTNGWGHTRQFTVVNLSNFKSQLSYTMVKKEKYQMTFFGFHTSLA